MRRIVIWLASTVTIVVLLFGYHTSTSGPGETAAATSPATTSSTGSASASASSPSASSPSSSSTASSGGSPDPTATPSASSSASASTSTAAKSYTGAVAQTRWGPVQVKITVSSGTISTVDVVQYPSGNGKDQEINSYAIPVLTQDTLDNQSATIDMISGATVTSDGYVQSLQSALDQAGL